MIMIRCPVGTVVLQLDRARMLADSFILKCSKLGGGEQMPLRWPGRISQSIAFNTQGHIVERLLIPLGSM